MALSSLSFSVMLATQQQKLRFKEDVTSGDLGAERLFGAYRARQVFCECQPNVGAFLSGFICSSYHH